MSTRISSIAAVGLAAALAVPALAATTVLAADPSPSPSPIAVGHGGATVDATAVARPGDDLPATLRGVGYMFDKTPKKGQPVPAKTTVVTAQVTIARKHAKRPTVSVTCPGRQRVAAGYQTSAPSANHGSWSLDRDAQGSLVRRARFVHRGKADTTTASLLLLCRQPDADGSFALHPRETESGETAAHVRRGAHYLYASPGKTVRGTVWGGQPVSIVRTDDAGKWAYVITDVSGIRGWVSAAALR